MVPMTLVSLTVVRLPLPRAVPVTSMWTTVSAPDSASTRAMVGWRMSAWMNSAPPRWCPGATASTAITRSTCGSRWIRRTNRPPSWRATPVTSTTFPKISAFLLSYPCAANLAPGCCAVMTARPTTFRVPANARSDITVAPHRMRWGATGDALAAPRRLLLVTTLHARALQQLAVLLLSHPLAPLLDNRAHDYPRSLLITRCWASWAHTTYKGPAYPSER